ncbi:uncharacterized protein LOC132758714 isoform X2 [Ruditapes philippinarum]|uniref:uncharacterized protein LOC132758714 isoform X2 n=1 Tax=Ruditapes philippinarum TaxID=129788 RepID=UPI00295B6FD3|nr:uncharacterized protein LOC132758714 isoform X2 [Ruditapes philippinarum]
MSGKEIQVFVKGISASTSNLIIDKNATVAELFEKFSEHIGLTGNFGLVYGGKELKEVDPNGKVMHIKDYGIEDESTIGAVMRLPGGSENEKRYGPKVKLSRKPDMLGIDDQAIDMSCGHAIGPTSMTNYVQTEVADKKHTICCPAMVDDKKNETCRQPWEFKKIKKVALFTKNERTDVEGKISDNYIRYALKSQQCPKCKSNCVRKDKSNPRVICLYCSAASNVLFEFCWICLRVWRTSGTNTCGNENCENQETDSPGPCTNNMSQTSTDMLGRWKERASQFFRDLFFCCYNMHDYIE